MDAMNEQITEDVAYTKGYDKGFSDAQENLSKKFDKYYEKGFNKGWQKNEYQDKWIQMKDEAPEENRLLIYFFDGLMMPFWIGFYFGRDETYPSEDNHIFGSPAGFLTGDVTHWMYVDAPERYEWVMDNNEELAKSLKDSVEKARAEFDLKSKENQE